MSYSNILFRPSDNDFSLASLGEKLRLDFDAENVVTDGSGFVTSIVDSANGVSLANQNGSPAATVITGSHGRPAVLVPSGDWFQVLGNDLVADDTEGEWFHVYRCTDEGNAYNCVFSVGAGNSSGRYLGFRTRPGDLNNQSNIAGKMFNSTSGRNYNDFYLRTRCWNIASASGDGVGTVGFLRRRSQIIPMTTENGEDAWFSDVEDSPTFRPDDIALFSRVSWSDQRDPFVGEWSRTIVTTKLTDTERANLIAYLQNRYRIRHYLVAGDSISNNDTDWTGKFVTEAETRNLPYHLNTFANGGDDIDEIKLQVDNNIIGTDYDEVILLGGINSIISDASAASILATIQQIRDDVIADGKQITICTLLPFGGDDDWTAGRQTELETLNTGIRAMSSQSGTTIRDCYLAMGDPIDPQSMPPEYTNDGLHPNDTGSEVLAEFIITGETTVQALVRMQSPSPLDVATQLGSELDWQPTLLVGQGGGVYSIDNLPSGVDPIDPSTGRITGTPDTLGATNAELTYTEDGKTDRLVLKFHVYDQVDTTELVAGNYSSEWNPPVANRRYDMQGDMYFDDIGLVLSQPNTLVVFNGYTVYYDNAPPTYAAIVNHQFQSGDSTGWDVSNIPGLTGYAADAFLNARSPDASTNALHSTVAAGATEYLETIQNFLVTAGERFAVGGFFTCPGIAGSCDIQVSVGSNSSSVVGYGDDFYDTNNGFRPGSYIYFEIDAVSTESAPIRITWTNNSGAPAEVNISDIFLLRSSVGAGVAAGLADADYKPNQVANGAADVTICNGSIVQVQKSPESPCVDAGDNMWVDNISHLSNPEVMYNRSCPVSLLDRGLVLSNNTFDTTATKICSRDNSHGWLVQPWTTTAAQGVGVHYRDNTALRTPQGAFAAHGRDGHDYASQAKFNTINIQGRYTNGFGLVAKGFAGSRYENKYNVIDLTQGADDNGRGYRVGGYAENEGNQVRVRSLPLNQEYFASPAFGHQLGGAYAFQAEENLEGVSFLNESLYVTGIGGGGGIRVNGTSVADDPLVADGMTVQIEVTGSPVFDAACIKLSGNNIDLDEFQFSNSTLTSNYHLFDFTNAIEGTAVFTDFQLELIDDGFYSEPWLPLSGGTLIFDNPNKPLFLTQFTDDEVTAHSDIGDKVFIGYPQPTSISPGSINIDDGTDTTGGVVAATLTTNHENANESGFVYNIEFGADAASFSISESDLIIDDGVLDEATKDTYIVDVRSTDSFGQTVIQTITVSVSSEATAPTISAVSNCLIDDNRIVREMPVAANDDNDLLVWIITDKGDSNVEGSLNVPGTWIPKAYGKETTHVHTWVLMKYASSEPGTYDIDFTGAPEDFGFRSAVMFAIKGTTVDIADIDVAMLGTGGGVTSPALTLSAAGPNLCLRSVANFNQNQATTVPADHVLAASDASIGNQIHVASIESSENLPAIDWTIAGGPRKHHVVLAIPPA